ncbi:IclR family transcriptional regulator [Diaminobutyricibacter tongyongensis]|uniref:IclR family transcriptional regulator n=1 Tax=Leifsonia tongyongensis TaxID=1268043 RepID=A0A6L9XUA6_9MICO|nr:IclR family transcriptional regulator [Diaminobutyricibacter tongyongensis]NEN04972.1 IclR family transcriptional regulator [Diaminobutyricibacter tongyongensis]
MPDRPSATDGEERLVGADRVLSVLVELAGLSHGASLDEMVQRTRSPKATVHRALASLRRAGLAKQDARGHYILGDEFLRLAFAHHEARPEHIRVRPILDRLSERFSETIHFAVLDGYDVVYREKVDPTSGAVRLSSTIGGRNPAHSTGVGKALLATRLHSLADVEAWIGDRTLEQRTPRTATSAPELHRRLAETRERGFAVDDQENEAGINCVAVPLYLASPSEPSGAVSVSAVAYRTPLADLIGAIDQIHDIIREGTS